MGVVLRPRPYAASPLPRRGRVRAETLADSVLWSPKNARQVRPAIDPGKPACGRPADQRGMAGHRQPLDNRPEVLLIGHPAEAVEARQGQRTGVRAYAAVPVPVQVVLEVAQDRPAD